MHDPSPQAMQPTVTVFYDGSCPLCATEIQFYQRRRGPEQVTWIDASACSNSMLAPGLSRADALRRFHVRDAAGQLASRGRAFAVLWSALPAFSWLGRLFLQNRGLSWLLAGRALHAFPRWAPASAGVGASLAKPSWSANRRLQAITILA